MLLLLLLFITGVLSSSFHSNTCLFDSCKVVSPHSFASKVRPNVTFVETESTVVERRAVLFIPITLSGNGSLVFSILSHEFVTANFTIGMALVESARDILACSKPSSRRGGCSLGYFSMRGAPLFNATTCVQAYYRNLFPEIEGIAIILPPWLNRHKIDYELYHDGAPFLSCETSCPDSQTRVLIESREPVIPESYACRVPTGVVGSSYTNYTTISEPILAETMARGETVYMIARTITPGVAIEVQGKVQYGSAFSAMIRGGGPLDIFLACSDYPCTIAWSITNKTPLCTPALPLPALPATVPPCPPRPMSDCACAYPISYWREHAREWTREPYFALQTTCNRSQSWADALETGEEREKEWIAAALNTRDCRPPDSIAQALSFARDNPCTFQNTVFSLFNEGLLDHVVSCANVLL